MGTLATSSFWAKETESLRSLLRINDTRNALDVEKRRQESSCLGAAVGLEQDAVALVLVGLDDESRRYFEAIRQLALEAFGANERYVYKDPDGRNHFGKYMAMRIACLAEWVLGGSQRSRFYSSMLNFFEQVVHTDRERAAPDATDSDPTVIGHLAMHYAQGGHWDRLASLPKADTKRFRSGAHWARLHEILVLLGEAVVKADAGKRAAAQGRLNAWFDVHTDAEKLQRPFDPRFTANDIVSIAEIRASTLYAVTDPLVTIRSIRWPALVVAPA